MESISRLSGILESARELTLDAARDVRRSTSEPVSTAQLRKLLDSRHEAEVLEGLRRVIALSSRPSATGSNPVLFSAVLKNIASPSVAVKKLVYLYLLQHAESEPDTALLAINTIQKTLSAPDPQLRALALRVMSGLRVPVISQIVSLGIKKGCADMSPLVRRAAALAIPKCRRLDPSTEPQLLDYLSQLLGDKQYYVAGAAVLAFMEICPDRIDLIHKHYRSLVRKLVDMDEWGQIATLRLMTTYARLCFPPKAQKARNDGTPSPVNSEDDIDPDLTLLLRAAQPLLQSRNSAVITAVARLYLYLTPSDSSYLQSAVGPLVSILRDSVFIQQIVLHSIVQVALALPASFTRYLGHFLVRASDPSSVRSLKMELLTIVFPHCTSHARSLVLAELAHFASSSATRSDGDDYLARDAVRAIGRCAQVRASDPSDPTSGRCLRLLLSLISDGESAANGELVAEALTVVRHLIQADPAAHVGTVTRLAKNLDIMTSPRARASTIWLIGEYSGVEYASGGNIAADVLRILAKGFVDEAVEAKLQIVLLAAKVRLHDLNAIQDTRANDTPAISEEARGSNGINGDSDPTVQPHKTADTQDPIGPLYDYIMLLARYDKSYDLRDRSRVYRALLSAPESTQLATLLLLAPKPVPQAPSPSESRRSFMLGSASGVVGADIAGTGGLPGYTVVPDWARAGSEPDARLRDNGDTDLRGGFTSGAMGLPLRSAVGAVVSQANGLENTSGPVRKSAPAKEKTLDDWLAEDGLQSEEETSDEEDDDEDESDDDDEYDEEESDEETEEETDEDSASEAGNHKEVRLVQ